MSQQISYKAFEGSAPENYERYFVPVIAGPLAKDLVDSAAPRPGERVLDVACGTGIAARLAAQRVGQTGAVAAVDINPGMLAVARAATPAEPAVDWREGSADALPIATESCDVVLCSLGLMFFPDKQAALQEMARALAPGGRVLFNVPGPIPQIFAVIERVLGRHLSDEAAGFVRQVFSVHDAGVIRSLLAEAQLGDLTVSSTTKTLPLPAPEDFVWQYIHLTPLAAVAASMDDEQRATVTREVADGCRPYTTDGGMLLQVRVTTGGGTKEAG